MTKRLGIIGVGRLGSAIGRLALEAGWELRVSDRAGQPLLELVVASVLPGAELVDERALVAASDVVVLAVPQPALAELDIEGMGDAVVVDATNAWAATDGVRADGAAPVALLTRNPRLRLARTLNHLAYADLLADARAAPEAGRRAVGVAADDPEAVRRVAALVDDLGFDPVRLPLAEAHLLAPGGPVFGRRLDAADLAAALGVPKG